MLTSLFLRVICFDFKWMSVLPAVGPLELESQRAGSCCVGGSNTTSDSSKCSQLLSHPSGPEG